MPIVNYVVLKTDYINEKQYCEYKEFIKDTLTDPRSWSQYGYDFVENDCKGTLKIRFVNNNFLVKKFGKQINKLSCYVPSNHEIYFNLSNWNCGLTWDNEMFSDKDGEDGLTRYRRYVIIHECGHALGLDHPPTKDVPYTSVMMQNTKGRSWLNKGCTNHKKDYQCWPLSREIFDEECGARSNRLNFKGGGRSPCFFFYLSIILLIVLLVTKVISKFSPKVTYDRKTYNLQSRRIS